MDMFKAVMIAEGQYEVSLPELAEAWQYLIDTGAAWRLPGSFGRTAKALIEDGVCTPAGAP